MAGAIGSATRGDANRLPTQGAPRHTPKLVGSRRKAAAARAWEEGRRPRFWYRPPFTTGQRAQLSTPRDAKRDAPPANDDRRPAPATKPAIVAAARKRRSDGPHLPMELPLSRKPVERDGDDYKRMKAAMARRLRRE